MLTLNCCEDVLFVKMFICQVAHYLHAYPCTPTTVDTLTDDDK